MKKILFLLSILSFSFSYGQTTLANKLRITGNTTSATATKVNVQEANGEVNTIAKSDLTDVLKYATASAFPLTGVFGKLYYDIATDLYYKWDGATYEEFGAGGTETDPLALKIANNLSDLSNVSTARTNLGLGTLATQNGTFTDKQDVLVSATNIKTVQGQSVLGSGNLSVGDISNSNTAIGLNAGTGAITGAGNSFFGLDSGKSNTSGTSNSFFGANSGELNTSGGNNTFVGFNSGTANTIGGTNTFVGFGTGTANTSGNSNTFIGFNSGVGNTTANNNTFYGVNSGAGAVTGAGNTFNGVQSGQSNTSGANNTFIGFNSGQSNTTGSTNTFVGNNSGRYLSDGSTSNSTSSNSVFLGNNTRANGATQTNQIVIGDTAIGAGSNTATIGNTSITSTVINGLITAPLTTNALIDAESTGKAVVTKEWVQANSGGSGSTNLFTTYAPTTVTIVSSSGTDATVNAVDGTNAGIVTPTQKADWDAKQTASQVTTAISSRITNDPYSSAWDADVTNTASLDILYDQFEVVQGQLNNKQPLSSVLTATTASFTTVDETKLDGIATGATANSSDATLLARANHTGTQTASTISDFNSATRAQVEAELVAGTNITITPSGTGATRQLTIASTASTPTQGAYTVLANNTASTATPTEQVFKSMTEQTYSGTITWGTTAPTTILNNTFEWQQIGKMVNLRINLSYNSPATNQQVTIALPSGLPTPSDVTGFTGASNVFAFGSGMMYNDIATLPASAGRYCLLRRNSANNGFEIVVTHGSAISVKTVALTIQYFAQ